MAEETPVEPEVRRRDERAIRRELLALKNAHPEKLLVAEEVVKAAENEASALHGEFTWDDSAAARLHRLNEARTLIRSIDVIMPDDPNETVLPRFVSLRSDRRRVGGGYRETKDVMGNAELLAELEATARRDISGLLRRYEMLRDFCAKVRAAAGIEQPAHAEESGKVAGE